MLSREKCLESLAETVRTLFFQTKAPRLLNCIATCRILKVPDFLIALYTEGQIIAGAYGRENVQLHLAMNSYAN